MDDEELAYPQSVNDPAPPLPPDGAVTSCEHAAQREHIRLNYYNLFWIFVVCSAAGLALESLYHAVEAGGYQSRAGLVWGPFSPIYGCGAVVFTVALNRFCDRNGAVIFLVTMGLGMTLEFCTSWVMQTFFGCTSWDYSGTFGNIQGRTNIMFGLMWGVLGLLWVRFLLPGALWVISLIPWQHHLAITVLMSVFMAFNIAVTIGVINRAFERQEGLPAQTTIQQLCDEHFPDSWVQQHFANLSMDTSLSIRK